jgi:hypothetical protein
MPGIDFNVLRGEITMQQVHGALRAQDARLGDFYTGRRGDRTHAKPLPHDVVISPISVSNQARA